MPGLRPNKFWMFWGIMFSVLGIILFNANFIPEQDIQDAQARVERASVARAETPRLDGMSEADVKISKSVIDFTKKAACRQNVRVIDTMVELWHLEKGFWPKLDLSDIGRDKDYFPRGLPRCPVNGEPYRLEPGVYRVEGHTHTEIDSPLERTTPAPTAAADPGGLPDPHHHRGEDSERRASEYMDRSDAAPENRGGP